MFQVRPPPLFDPAHPLSALNIEHFLERTAAFVVIVLGEMVLNVVYHAGPDQVGFKKFVTVYSFIAF